MALGPIEVLVIEFPGNQFNGGILPELDRLVESGTISIVDGLFIQKDENGDVVFLELEEVGADEHVARLAGLLDQVESLISDEDVDEMAAALHPNCSAAMLVFEHTWANPLRDAIVGSGGILAANFRIPGMVVDELLDELAAID